jgi:hypothetical protein
VRGLATDPQVSGTVYAWNGKGLFKSTDAGGSWNALGSFGHVNTLAIDPQNPTTLYASGGGDDGVFKSTDGGATWTEVNSGLPEIYLNLAYQYTVSSIAIDPQTPSTIYAGTGAGVFRSTDGGATWGAVNAGLTALDVTTLAIEPQDGGAVYAGTVGGVFAITFVPAAAPSALTSTTAFRGAQR